RVAGEILRPIGGRREGGIPGAAGIAAVKPPAEPAAVAAAKPDRAAAVAAEVAAADRTECVVRAATDGCAAAPFITAVAEPGQRLLGGEAQGGNTQHAGNPSFPFHGGDRSVWTRAAGLVHRPDGGRAPLVSAQIYHCVFATPVAATHFRDLSSSARTQDAQNAAAFANAQALPAKHETTRLSLKKPRRRVETPLRRPRRPPPTCSPERRSLFAG